MINRAYCHRPIHAKAYRSCVDCSQGKTALQRQQYLYLCAYYSTDWLARQLDGLFGMLQNMQKGRYIWDSTPLQDRKMCAALDSDIYMKNSCKSGKAVMPIPREGFNTPVESIGTGAPHVGDDVLRSLPKQKVKSLAEMSRPILQKMCNNIVTTNAAPGIDAGFLNSMEQCIKNGGMTYYLATPYHLYTNPTLNSGTTRTDTVTGVGSIPASGVLGIKMGVGVIPSGTTGYVQVYPQGGTAGLYVSFGSVVAGQYQTGFIEVPISSGGQITVKAVGANIVLQDWYIVAYVM